jgi:GWxTD domain-containing protein
MKLTLLNIIKTGTLLALLQISTGLFAQPQRAYERGLEEIYSGNITQALDIWYSAYNQPGDIDSRIGFEFIRVVTENRRRSYFEAATTMYKRSLSDGMGPESRAAIRQEIERMKPIIGDGIYRQWIEWWEQRNNVLASDMRGFWIQLDPTPANPPNERLIEHWERIAEARRQFTRNNTTAYGTDDRSLIYVRYGEPDRIRRGILTLQSLNVRNWLERQMNEPIDTDLEERTLSDPDLRDREFANRILDAMYTYHQYPEYEVWFYENIADNQQEPVIFLFGTDIHNDEFRLQTSLEDFIPERAFNPERTRSEDDIRFTRAGITPALMLQLLYYEQLAQADTFFERRLNELRSRILEQGQEAFSGLDLSFRSENRQIVNLRADQVSRQKSAYESVIPRIPLQVYQYRFLDQNLNPVLLTYIESSAQEAFQIDYHRNRGRFLNGTDLNNGNLNPENNGFYELTHSLLTYDESWNIIQTHEDRPQLITDRVPRNQVSESFFRLPHTKRAFQSASVELMNYDPDSRPLIDTPFSPALRGWNKQQLRQPPPLRNHPDSLEVADLVLGYLKDGYSTKPFSFLVANNQIVPFGETLMLHFEVYNLRRMYNGFTQFELTYRIFPVDEDGNVLTDQTEFILTLNFTNEDTVVIEDLEIETADLGAGLYQLVVYISDLESELSKERSIRFEVIE